MRNSVFEARNGRGLRLAELLEHPVFSNTVRLFIIVILALGGYIWKVEMDHVNRSLEDIKTNVNEAIRRQWEEVNDMKREVTQVNREVNQVLYRTNEMLFEILDNMADARDGGGPRTPGR